MGKQYKDNDVSGGGVVGAKIRKNQKEALKAIAKHYGLTVSDMIHCVIDAFFRYLSPDQIITPQLETIVNSFANFQVGRDSFMWYDSKSIAKREVKSAIVFVKQEGKPQAQPILIYQKADETFESIKNDNILLVFLRAFAPKLLPDLREIEKANNLLSLTDALKFAVKEQTAPTKYDITMDIESMFSDNMRAENGKKIDYEDTATQYVKHYKRDISYMEREEKELPFNR